MKEVKSWWLRLTLLFIAGFFLFLSFGSLELAINWASLFEFFETFWVVSILISSIGAFIVFVVLTFSFLLVFCFSFIDSKGDVRV